MNFLQAFVCRYPPPFDGLELRLATPQRGSTCSFRWSVQNGQLVPSGQVLFQQYSDADPNEPQEFTAPFPGRVLIEQPEGRYLRPDCIGRLQYGLALDLALRQEWQDLALDLTDSIIRPQQAGSGADLGPRELVKLVFLDFALGSALEKANRRRRTPEVPEDLREDRAQAALDGLHRWKAAAVRNNAGKLPADVTDQTLMWWKYFFDNLIVTLRHDHLRREDSLTADCEEE